MKILVSGLITIETTAKIDGFPIEYSPIDYKFFGNRSTISGVGYNVIKAIKKLGVIQFYSQLLATIYIKI